MLRKNPVKSGQADMFRERLEAIIDLSHPISRLCEVVKWEWLASSLSGYYSEQTGRPGGSIRLMAGLLMLKDLGGESDESLCAKWVENPYWQYFCGEEYFCHHFPIEPESLVYFRKRIGEAGLEVIFAETIRLGLVSGVVKKKEIETVTVDTTVQEKAVGFPTDTKLRHTAREALVFLAKEAGIELRQSYGRLSKHAVFMANRYGAARQMNRAKKEQRKVKNYLGRVIRNIRRELGKRPEMGGLFAEVLRKADIAFAQARDSKEKLYAWHAPEVECIAKGKQAKKYEFGCKVSITSTNKSNFIVGAKAFHGCPHDGKTLKDALEQVKKITGILPREAQVDQGYKGHGVTETEVIIARQKRGVTHAIKRRQKRRNAIEPIIGHCKNDRNVGSRNWLKGKEGDKINAIAMAIGFNLRKILRAIFLYLFYLMHFRKTYPYQAHA
jgi:IS5 family transposase